VSRQDARWALEALVRWRHPQLGLISPDNFIPLAEDTGLIDPLGELVLGQACTDAVGWPSHIKIAVNLSPLQFQDPEFANHVSRIILASGLPPQRLELEITESVLLYSSDRNIATLHALRGLGIAIALDDFGTGYSSLSYLRMFPFDKIKIDKSFVGELMAALGVCVGKLHDFSTLAPTIKGRASRPLWDQNRALWHGRRSAFVDPERGPGSLVHAGNSISLDQGLSAAGPDDAGRRRRTCSNSRCLGEYLTIYHEFVAAG
jgi:hypothetical protein